MHAAYPTRLGNLIFVLALLVTSSLMSLAQPLIQLGVESDPVCSIDDLYCATLKIKLKDAILPEDNEVQIGTSGIMVIYNLSALSFASYTSHNFDENNECFPDVPDLDVWAPHGYSGTVGGKVNIVLQLSTLEAYSCPVITNEEWIDIGTICFNILDPEANVQIGYSNNDELTNFNRNIPNNGTVGVAVDYGTLGNIQGTAVIAGIDEPLIVNNGESEICQAGTGMPASTTLSIANDVPSGFTPQWQQDGNDIAGETGNTLSANQEGDYSVYFLSNTDATCYSGNSNSINITLTNCDISSGACPTVTPVYEVQNLCEGGSGINAALTQWENSISIDSDPNGTGGNLVLSGTPVGTANFPSPTPTGNYEGDGCNLNIQVWYAAYECDSNGDGIIDNYVNAGTFSANIYPIPLAPTVNQSYDTNTELCDYTVEPACLGDTFDITPLDLKLGCDDIPTDITVIVTNGQGCEMTYQLERPACVSCGLPECQLMPTDIVVSECSPDGTYTIDIDYTFNPNYTGEQLYIYDSDNFFVVSFFLGNDVTLGPFEANGSTESYTLYNFSLSGCAVSTGPISAPSCGSCDDPNVQVQQDYNACSGQTFDLNDVVQANPNTTWTSQNGGPLSGSMVNANNNSCSSILYQYQGTYTDQSGSCSINYSYSVNAYIYPSGNISISSSSDCGASVSVLCSNYNVSWSDSQGNTGTGSSYQSNDGNAGTVVFTAMNPDFPDCESTVSHNYTCGATCPTNSQTDQSSTSVCSGGSLNLNSFLPTSNYTNLQWTNAAGNASTNPTNWVANNNTCQTSVRDLTATYQTQDAAGCPIEHTFTLSIDIYAKPQLSLVANDDCATTVSINCNNFDVNWSDDEGNSGTGTDYQATEGSSGTVTFSATNPASSDCSSDNINADYNCAISCQTTTETAQDSETICNGNSLNLNNYLPDNNYTNLAWINAAGNPINSPTNWVANNTACQTSLRDLTATYETQDAAGCTIEHTFTLIISIYATPQLSTVTTESCLVEVSVNCSNFPVTWADNEGNSGTGTTYQANAGSAGQVTFSSMNPDNNCEENLAFAYNCESNCPTTLETGQGSTEICSGSSINLNDFIPNSIADLEWKDSNNNTVDNPQLLTLENNSCAVSTQTFIANYQTSEAGTNCPIDNEFTLSVTVYALPELSIVSSTNCDVVVEANCPDFTVNWQDTNGNSGTGLSFQGIETESGQVTFTTNNSNISGCETSFTYAYSCPVNCSNPTQETEDSESVCSGETLNLNSFLPNSNYSNLQWTNQVNGVINNPDNTVLTNNTCTNAVRTFTATYQTQDAQDCPTNHILTLTATVFPIPELTMISSGACTVEVNANCSNFAVTWTDTEGNNGTGTTYQAAEGSTGQVTFTTSDANCGNAEMAFGFSCPQDCETIQESSQSFISNCSGTTFSLTEQLLVSNYTGLQWTDNNNNSVGNDNITLMNTGCDAYTETYTATFETLETNTGCPISNTFSLHVEVTPIPVLTLVSNENCVVVVEANCPNLEVTWQDTQGNSGNGASYSANNTQGSVNFTVSNNFGVTCSDQLFISYDCEDVQPCNDSTSFLDDVPFSMCSESNINLNNLVDAPQGTNLFWSNSNNQNINNANNYVATNNSCAPIQETLTAMWEETDANGCISNYYQNVVLSVYTQIELVTQTQDCSVQVSSNCEARINISWEDNNNNQGSGTSYQATNDVGFVNFYATWNDGSAICEDLVAVPYACSNPPNTNPTGQTDLEVMIEVGNAVESYEVGDWVYWVVTVENTSTVTANNVIVSVPLSSSVEYLASAGDGTYNETTEQWILGSIPPFTIRTLVVYTFITESGIVMNYAAVESADETDLDSTPGNINPNEDDYSEVSIETVASTPEGENGCVLDINTCTQEFTSIDVCIEFCGTNVVITDIESPYHCNVDQISPTCFRYLPYPNFNGTHEITVTGCNDNGSCETAITTIDVDNSCEINGRFENNTFSTCGVTIPNIITPNNDGINDYWNIPDLYDCYANYEMELMVFSSLGQTVIEEKHKVDSFSSNVFWETANEYNVGTYFYLLKLTGENNQQTYSGFLELRK